MLRDYEILYIVRPELDETQLNDAVKTVETLISNLGGQPQRTDVWGRRRLAYEVAHVREGQYVLTDFQIDAERVKEMESTLKISETVFRHLIVRKPEKTAREKAAAAAAAEKAATAAAEAAAAAPAPEAQTAAAEAAPHEGAEGEPAEQQAEQEDRA